MTPTFWTRRRAELLEQRQRAEAAGDYLGEMRALAALSRIERARFAAGKLDVRAGR